MNRPRLPRVIHDFRITPTRQQIFMFSAVTWNRHHVHFDRAAAQGEGLPDVVVQRALLGNFLGRLIELWLCDRGVVERLEWKVRRSALPGRELVCTAEVTDPAQGCGERSEGEMLRCSLRVVDPEGRVVAEGRATVRLREGVTLDG
jgi:hydroxyacyl-ACP dehydratase HTD2-like protein with hotdog domain